ncbi:MAG: DUF3040 domain-containing protein [Nocardioidaceae bacterium]|nr:DUF3040 domain-containing protein [Nocardioidaceae bacterium]MDQ3165344.1 DUF3040 domain-containing protein [Actinomycetota bacterium]
MPLSEEEQRLLQQMEQALTAEDPKFASALRGSTLAARSRRHALLAAVGFVLGVVVLMVGAVYANTAVSVAGFLVMLGAAYLFVMLWRRSKGSAAQPEVPRLASRRTSSSSSGSSSGSFMERMEERWRRRRDDDI